MIGSASRQACFIVVDCPKPWTAKIQASSGFPAGAREAVEAVLQQGHSFGLLGRVPLGEPTEMSVFLPLQTGGATRLDLRLDDPALAEKLTLAVEYGSPGQPAEPVLLVCTHGSRDRCCGTLGVPLLQAARAVGSREVWEVSHLGGHRFAPTCLALPEWRTFGRVGPADAAGLLASLDSGSADQLQWLRGGNALPGPVQILEAEWAREVGRMPDSSLPGEVGNDPLEAAIVCRFGEDERSRRARLSTSSRVGTASCADLGKAPRRETSYHFERWIEP